MSLDWKNQYCENDYMTQGSHMGSPYQVNNDILHRIRIKNFTMFMETQKTLHSQSNLEKEKESWSNQAP